MPHVCVAPRLTSANFSSLEIAVGTRCSVAGTSAASIPPMPNWPLRLSPQHSTVSLVVIPHACSQPATTRLNFTLSATETGVGDTVDAPIATAAAPTSPRWLNPQQRHVPSVVMPHVVMRPTEMLDQNDPSTRVYELPDRPTFPSPNSPSPARPQQNARLSGVIPHVCCDGPMDNDARVAGDVPAVGGSVIFTGVGLDARSVGAVPYSKRVELSPQQYSAPP